MLLEIYEEVKGGISQKEIKKLMTEIFVFLKKGGPMAVHLVGTKKIKLLNKKYRGLDKETDVLSFPIAESTDWGDIFICIPKIKKQAKEYGVSFQEECKRMLIHGVLHLAGFDHKNKKEADKMFKLQEKVLKENL